jgi:ABC-type sugar transport system ATPase subunit
MDRRPATALQQKAGVAALRFPAANQDYIRAGFYFCRQQAVPRVLPPVRPRVPLSGARWHRIPVDGFRRCAAVCAKTSESGDDRPDRAIFRGIRQPNFESKVVLVKARVALSSPPRLRHRPAKPFGFVLNNKKISKMSWKYCHDLSIKTADINQNILGLSGGNQQKVIIARMLSTEPNVILADEPTRGVDVGAKAEIFSILRSLKNMNKAIIVISSELKEVVKECDRILVMRNGRIVGEVKEPDGREEKILNFAFNG